MCTIFFDIITKDLRNHVTGSLTNSCLGNFFDIITKDLRKMPCENCPVFLSLWNNGQSTFLNLEFKSKFDLIDCLTQFLPRLSILQFPMINYIMDFITLVRLSPRLTIWNGLTNNKVINQSSRMIRYVAYISDLNNINICYYETL